MFEQVIQALHRFNTDPTWIAFKQQNGTIPLGPISTNECVNPLYKLQAQSLADCIMHVMRGERMPGVWASLDAGTQAEIDKVTAEQFQKAGFPLVKIQLYGETFTAIRTAHGLLLAE